MWGRTPTPTPTRKEQHVNEGNTPQTWGGGARPDELRTAQGNTPTNVGRSWRHSPRVAFSRKHPHERGEEVRESRPSPCPSETPPRTWGGELAQTDRWFIVGNTPTNVGRSGDDCVCVFHVKKHPHERGEESSHLPKKSPRMETPPRTWGGAQAVRLQAHQDGNTPTNVGMRTSA